MVLIRIKGVVDSVTDHNGSNLEALSVFFRRIIYQTFSWYCHIEHTPLLWWQTVPYFWWSALRHSKTGECHVWACWHESRKDICCIRKICESNWLPYFWCSQVLSRSKFSVAIGSLTSWLSQNPVGDAAVKTAVASFCRTVVPTFLDRYRTTDPSLQGNHFLCIAYSHYHVYVSIGQGSLERLGDDVRSGVLTYSNVCVISDRPERTRRLFFWLIFYTDTRAPTNKKSSALLLSRILPQNTHTLL